MHDHTDDTLTLTLPAPAPAEAEPPAAGAPAEAEPHQVLLVGTLLEEGRRPTVTATAALARPLRILVVEEDGDSYSLRLSYVPRAPQDRLPPAGTRVVIAGRLTWRVTYDFRFASLEQPLGRQRRELGILVLAVRPATEADLDGSWFRVRGRIAYPPQLRAHEHWPSLRVARTSISVPVAQPSRRPGSRAVLISHELLPLDVPLTLAGAGAALRVDNEVIVEGRLESFRFRLDPRREPLVAARLEQEQRAEGAPAGLVRRVRALTSEQRLRLRAGYIELCAGTPLDEAQARAQRAAFLERQRAQRAPRRSS